MSCKKIMEYREIATKMFLYKKTNIKLLGNYLQKNSKWYWAQFELITFGAGVSSKFISRNSQKTIWDPL